MPKFKARTTLKLVIPLGVLIVGTPIFDITATAGKIYPGVTVASLDLGGQRASEAQTALEQAATRFLNDSTTLTVGQVEMRVSHKAIYSFDLEKTLADAQDIGHTGTLLDKLSERAQARAKGVDLAPRGALDQDALARELKQSLSFLETQARDAKFLITFDKKGKESVVSVLPEAQGKAPDFEALERAFQLQIATLQAGVIPVVLHDETPQITAQDLEPWTNEVKTILDHEPRKIKVEGRDFTLTPQTLAAWIVSTKREGQAEIALDKSATQTWLAEIAKQVEYTPQEAKFALSENMEKAEKFQMGAPGRKLLQEENFTILQSTILSNSPLPPLGGGTPPPSGGAEIHLLTRTVEPKLAVAPEAAELGIKELVGRATTNFKGSPPNRIKNIKRGAALLQNTLIAPDEEFSLLDHLRPFTTANGYLPELVIKAAEGKTTPEIGGGLCQIGTTMFRVALAAGLPITARQNHSYRVSYYEPPVGMDATIYDPWPDFKFINDTGAWLILTTAVEGTELSFELWGTKDGRTIETSKPEISNIRKPPEKKIIETTDLAPGKTKCTERAHIGSDARFTYKVIYADGRVAEQEFKSWYRPWQEVCLVGVEKPAEAPAEPLPPEAVPLSPDVAAPTPI